MCTLLLWNPLTLYEKIAKYAFEKRRVFEFGLKAIKWLRVWFKSYKFNTNKDTNMQWHIHKHQIQTLSRKNKQNLLIKSKSLLLLGQVCVRTQKQKTHKRVYKGLSPRFASILSELINFYSPWNHNFSDDFMGNRSYLIRLTFSAPTPQNGQLHSNNSSANCRRIVWVCLTIF